MTPEQQRKVTLRQRSMVSVPIFAWSKTDSRATNDIPVIGSLSIDSATPLAETEWCERGLEGEQVLRSYVTHIMQAWADIISKLLR